MPLKTLLSDSAWLVQAWLAMAVVIVPAALLRLRRAPSALDIWPGIVLLVFWLTALYLPDHALSGVIPTKATFTDLSHLMDSLHHTMNDETAPVVSTPGVRLVMGALLGLLAALNDLIAVVGRRGALAGVPLLVIYTVSGAVPRTPVEWFWFAPAAVGYLVLLALDADDELRAWGRRIARDGGPPARQVLGLSAQRIGVVAVVVAVVLPFLVPDHPRNVIADAFHGGSGGGVGSFGAGTGTGGISPFAALKGQLDRDRSIPLLQVHVDADPLVEPFYLRSNVLDRFTGTGWVVSGHGGTENIGDTTFTTEPPDRGQTVEYRAEVRVTGLSGNAPLFVQPRSLDGLDAATRWSSQDQVLLGGGIHKGDTYTEVVDQPRPSIDQLNSAPAANAAALRRWLALPPIPQYVVNLVQTITHGKTTPYAKARALSDWFANPANGFVYSLKTEVGDSGNVLVDFLKNKVGFCQQYAAAMAVMLRLVGIPSRVVLGYMHEPPNKSGNFTITTFDAHAWDEAFFPGIGWVPFDPTPPSGLAGGKQSDLVWAPHVYPSGSNSVPTPSGSSASAARSSSSAAAPAQAGRTGSGGSSGPSWPPVWVPLLVLGLVVLALLPAGLRAARRRRRFAAARRGNPDPLWAELSDTAVDLGYVWSPARTPRQVSAWLAPDAGDTAPVLTALANAVELSRYGPGTSRADTAELGRGLQQVSARLRSRRSARMRTRALLWPASLGWGGWLSTLRRPGRHR
jgi:transglutaminase-like putative cysteine protease